MIYVIVIIVSLLVLLGYLYRPCTLKLREGYASDSTLITTPVYRKDKALKAHNKKTLSNQIAPLNDMYRGKLEKPDVKVPAIRDALSTRIPDDMSNRMHYVLPMPNYNDLQGNRHRPKKYINSLKPHVFQKSTNPI